MENEIWTTKVAFSFENKYFFEDRRIYSGDTAPTGAARNSQIQQATADNNPAQVLATLVMLELMERIFARTREGTLGTSMANASIGNKRHNGGPSSKRRSMRRSLLNISAAKKLKGVPSSAIKENESRNGRSGNIQGRFWGRRRRRRRRRRNNLRDDHIFLV
ncbi:uncharacterized protein LOC141893118 isoform X1 [Acropora palmata]|uniref:uncharacterized protein LOC141893118 isoform X1 n=1 Tax=Acropora palmata TaxID=6131 RepID=UPI003DA03B76